MRQPDDWTESEANEAQMLNRVNELECVLNDQLNDCINFDGGKLTDHIMQKSSRTLKGVNMQNELMKFDPVTGEEKPYPSHADQYRIYHGMVAFLFNPWFGGRRHACDVGSDCYGYAILSTDQEKPLKAAQDA